jgi:hypothetical protein
VVTASLVLSAGNELSKAGKGIWRNMSITCEFDVDGVVRDVGDDAVEEELVVAAELLLDGGCREGKLRNRAKDGVVLGKGPNKALAVSRVLSYAASRSSPRIHAGDVGVANSSDDMLGVDCAQLAM